MTRLFAWIGISYLSALTAAVALGGTVTGGFALLCLTGAGVCAAVRPLRRIRPLLVVLLTMGVAFGAFFVHDARLESQVSALDGQAVLLTGRLSELPVHRNQRFYYLLDVQQLKTEQGEIVTGVGKIRVSTQNALDMDLYDTLEGTVMVSRPVGDGFSVWSSDLAHGIFLRGFLYEYEDCVIEPADSYPPYYYALRMREILLDSVRTMLPPEQAEVLAGAMLGQTEGVDEAVQEDFRAAGIAHLFAVSGLHLAMVSQLLERLMGACRVPKRLAVALSMAGILCFLALTGFPSSVVRSGIMLLIYLAGKLFRRHADSLNSLGFAALCLCVLNPYAGADLGLLLSFSATLGMLVFPRAAHRFFWRRSGSRQDSRAVRTAFWFWNSLSTTTAAVLFTLPVTILAFGRVSLIAPVANLLLAVPSALFIQFGFLAGIFHLLPAFSLLWEPLAFAAGCLIKIVCWAARLLASVPFSSVPASFGFVGIWLSAVLFLFGSALLLFHRRKVPVPLVSVLAVILLFLGILSHQESYRNVIRAAVLDVGDGVCVVLSRQGQAAVIGCGGYSSTPVLRYLSGQGIEQIDLIQLTDHSSDEMDHAAQILRAYPTQHVLLRQGEYVDGALEESLRKAAHVDHYRRESDMIFWNGRVRVQVHGTYEENGLWFSVDGLKFLVLPETAKIMPQDEHSDVLILEGIPEHGGEFHPLFTVLSMEEMPGPVAKESWPMGRSTYATNQQGAIVFDCEGREVTIRREH